MSKTGFMKGRVINRQRATVYLGEQYYLECDTTRAVDRTNKSRYDRSVTHAAGLIEHQLGVRQVEHHHAFIEPALSNRARQCVHIGKRLLDRLRRCTVSRESYAVRYRADLSIEAEDVGELFLARVTALEIAPGRTAEWEAFLEEHLPQFRGADVVFGIYQHVFGPGPPIWQIVENHSSFAELNQPSIIARTFGDQASEVAASFAGVLTSIERTVLRYDTELSYSALP